MSPDLKSGMGRRGFIRAVCLGCGALGGGVVSGALLSGRTLAGEQDFRKEAMFYEKLPDGVIRCLICPRQCVVGDSGRGYCDVRENLSGTYYTIVYKRVCTYHVDPIEKKPLFHFLPGTTAFSLATVGCNLDCKFCQNWEISQEKPENVDASMISPDDVAAATLGSKSPTVAYTYTEPTVYFEFMLDTARRGHAAGLKSVVISNGYINRDPLLLLCREMNAIKIDLKAYSQDFYAKVCNGNLKPVLDSIVAVKTSGTWLEIVYLVIPTLNDGEKDIDAMSKWLLANVGPEVPVHFTRFYPTYKLKNIPPTSVAAVERARQVAMARGLRYVYVGNVPSGHPGESTYCPGCGEVAIKRAGYTIQANNLRNGTCSRCGKVIPGVWS
jgi:pyruvate formate lyase activating enzyme